MKKKTNAQFSNAWRIENVCDASTQKVRTKMFATSFKLEKIIGNEWKKWSEDKCAKMIDEIPY
jgi:hypothetical protein